MVICLLTRANIMDLWLPLESHLLRCLRTFFRISRHLVLHQTGPDIRFGYKAIGLDEVMDTASEVETESFSRYGQQKSNNLVETHDTSVKWYSEQPGTRLTPETRAFFLQYAGLSEDELLPHLLSIVHCPYH